MMNRSIRHMIKLKTAVRLGLLALPLIASGKLAAQEAWLAKDADWSAHKDSLQTFGEGFDSAWDLYVHLQEAANGGERLSWEDMAQAPYEWSESLKRPWMWPGEW